MADEILQKVENISKDGELPPGYVRIDMSTKGLYGAPASFHVRNFSTEEAMSLGMVSTEELPVRIVNELQKLIYEKDVKISDFLEQEVSEFMIHFYINFYQTTLRDIKYAPTKEDKEWVLKTIYKGVESAEYNNWLRGIENGQIPVLYDLDLRKVQYYDVGNKAKNKVNYKKGNFSCVFQYPKFGDVVLLQKTIKEKFRAQDRQFGPLYETYKRKQEAEQRLRNGENVDIDAIPYIQAEDMDAIRAYELEKTAYIVSLMKGMYLYEIDGKDIHNLPLSERVEVAKDSRIDYPAYQMVSEAFKNLEIGPYHKVPFINPITQLPGEIEYPFRPLDMLAAIENYRPDDATIEYI